MEKFDKYIVTREGQVIGPRGLMKGQVDRGGYHRVQMILKGKRYWFSVHRLVAEKYLPNPDNLPQVNHKDGNKLNNHVDNLEWCTASENIKHSIKMGLHPTGSDVHTHKLTETQVMQIRELYKPYSRIYGTVRLAEQFGVSQRTISSIILRETWKC